MAYSVLTAAQGARLRNRIGDTLSSPQLSDTVLDSIYTDADDDLDVATVYALQELLGIYAMQVDVTDTNTLITEKRSQRFKALEDALAYWERKTGQTGGTLTVAKLKYNLNTKLADFDGQS